MTITKFVAVKTIDKWTRTQPILGWHTGEMASEIMTITNSTLIPPARIMLEVAVMIMNDHVTPLPIQRRYECYLDTAYLFVGNRRMFLECRPFGMLIKTDHFGTFMRKLSQMNHLIATWATEHEKELVSHVVLSVL